MSKQKREIKFRAWLKNKDEMVYKGDGLYIDGFTGDIYIPHLGKPSQLDRMDDVIIMQFTGLKDSKGVEIYEGDIVNHYDPTMGEKYEDRLQYKTIVDIYLSKTLNQERLIRIEVIGNIYENPELLK